MEPTQVGEGKYVYCIIKSKENRSFGPMGIGARNDEVYTVHYEDLAAVVSNTPIQVYDPTRENVLAHEQVNETVMREFTYDHDHTMGQGFRRIKRMDGTIRGSLVRPR